MLKNLLLKHLVMFDNGDTLKVKGEDMGYDEDELMETFDRWDHQERRQRFLRRMERKFYAKYHLQS